MYFINISNTIKSLKGSKQYTTTLTLRIKRSFASFFVASSAAVAIVVALLALLAITATFLDDDYYGSKNVAFAFAPTPSPAPIPRTNTLQPEPTVPSPPPAAANVTGGGINSNSNVPSLSSSNNNFLTYGNPTYGITMQYPSDWGLNETGDISSLEYLVYFSSPLSNGESGSVTIEIELGVPPYTLQEALGRSIYSNHSYFRDFNVVTANTNATLASQPAYLLIYTYTDAFDNARYQGREVGTIIGDRKYSVEYSAPLDIYNTFLPAANNMIDSFSISDSTFNSSMSSPSNSSSMVSQIPEQVNNMSSISPSPSSPFLLPPLADLAQNETSSVLEGNASEFLTGAPLSNDTVVSDIDTDATAGSTAGAIGGSGDATTTAATAVTIAAGSSSKTTDAFQPNPVQASVGSTVTWTNDDTQPHTVTSGANGTPDGKFDSSPNFNPLLVPGQTFSHTFTEAGQYPYFCLLHPNMVGTVSVVS